MAKPKSQPPQKGVNIQSKTHERLLNIIDDLRSQGISRFIDLPQLIVCGDQSSGKSSVLEAVSGLRFPTKDALCTRFATELILRRNPEAGSSVTIVPDANRPESEKKRLEAYKTEASVYDDFDSIVESAGIAMGLQGSSKVFSTDVLRIEISGPKQPHLTLVDLPGLFHAGSKSQSDDDAQAVKALVTSYMAKSRSVILAVVSAKNDYNNQIVTKYARDYDPDGERTMGIITKPDDLNKGSDSEKNYIELAANKDVKFRLGWHVLKNRSYDERNCTSQERDDSERQFFSQGIWPSLSPSQLGIDTLRPRLSKVLQGQILAELPYLIADVEVGIKDCEKRLARLGGPRGTQQEQRVHLHSVSEVFTTIMREAVHGSYYHDYFGDASSDEGFRKRIRASVRDTLEAFAEELRLKGHKYEILSSSETIVSGKQKGVPIKVTYSLRIEKVQELIRRNRGRELATTTKEETVTALFREQCAPWAGIAEHYADRIFAYVRSSMLLALQGSCDAATREGVLAVLIGPALEPLHAGFKAAVKRCLKQHVTGYPLTFNHYFTENIQKLRAQHDEKHMKQRLKDFFGIDPDSANPNTSMMVVNTAALLKAMSASNEADMSKFTCSEALHVMEAYYKVALKYFIDDFAIAAVEQALLEKIPEIFTPAIILRLEDQIIEDIAGETDESKLERASSSGKLETLKSALTVLRQLDRGQSPTQLSQATKRDANGAVKGDGDTGETEV